MKTGPTSNGESPATPAATTIRGRDALTVRSSSTRSTTAAAPQIAIVHLKLVTNGPRQEANHEEERLREYRVLVEEVAVRPASRRHLVRVMGIEVNVAVGVAIEEAAPHEGAREDEERRAR